MLYSIYTGKAFRRLTGEIKAGTFSAQSNWVYIHSDGIFDHILWRQRFNQLLSAQYILSDK